MTREEAIAVLEAIRQFTMKHYPWSTEDEDAIDMAISALCDSSEKMPNISDEPSDLISRAEAIKAIRKAEYVVADELEDLLNGLRSVSDERVGEWRCKDSADMSVFWYECSECGFAPAYKGTISRYHYCPNCGARMEGK